MFPIKRIEKIYQELHHYYLQVIALQDKDSQYQELWLNSQRIYQN
jgi:hypothetical protein